jgi:hypothetical protein
MESCFYNLFVKLHVTYLFASGKIFGITLTVSVVMYTYTYTMYIYKHVMFYATDFFSGCCLPIIGNDPSDFSAK